MAASVEDPGPPKESVPSADETREPSPPKNGTPKAADQSAGFAIDLGDALTADPNTEDMFKVDDNKFAFSPGQLSKLLNPKSHNAFYALGGLAGLEKGLRTNRNTGLSSDEGALEGAVTFEEVATKGASKYGKDGDTPPQPKPRDEQKKSKGKGKDKENAAANAIPPVQVKAGDKFYDRKRIFRDNRLPEKKSKSIFELAWIAYNDKVLILLTFAAIISLALGLYQTFAPDDKKSSENGSSDSGSSNNGTTNSGSSGGGSKVEWVEGVAILVAIVVVVVVSTLNDWQMERQFNKLNKKHNDRNVKVIRSGNSLEISVWDLMVGDVMHLSTGDLVPVDGIFISGHGVKCDESSATGESDLLKKVAGDEVFEALENFAKNGGNPREIEKLDPFIISGSKVNKGTGKFLVTAVGVNSSYGRTTMSLRTEQEDTPLQKKLNWLADWIARFGGGAALLLFVVLFIKFLAHLPSNHGTPREKGTEFMDLFIVAVTIVVVAVPEGLPLAVTLALAFATTRMMKDNNLVRVLKACETMGNATTICSDKTGTLTQNKMTVVACTLGKSVSFGGTEPPLDDTEKPASDTEKETATVPNGPVADFVKACGDDMKHFLIESNAVNSTAFEGDENGVKTFIGSKTEVALLTFCRDHLGAGPVQEERHNAEVVEVVPFDSAVKYMASVVKLPEDKGYRVYVKGASEILLSKCTKVLADPKADKISAVELREEDRRMFKHTISSYAGQTLRTIGSSYRDFSSWPPQEAVSEEDPKEFDFNAIHQDMTLVAIYGIKDPLRDAVKDAIKDCQKAGVVVRMVTGDNILTGKAIARECGIYRPEDGGIAMEGPSFRRLSHDELIEKVQHLQVLARSSPEDKRILVKTLKELGETVAVTGDGTNDAPALKMADIGFSMGIAGTEVAKEASAIILMDDNFNSIVKGMMWGRAVNDSVKKFLQFQLTVNVTAVVLTFVTSVASSEEKSVLKAVQLLWVNLIMDTFAALALATDAPSRSVLDRPPERKSAPLITLRMMKMILGQAICQLAITFVLHFGGKKLLGYDPETMPKAEERLNTLVFNTFVWLQIFNEVNNRRLDNKLNIFEGIHRNYFFLVMNVIMVAGQVLIIFKGGQAFEITPLNGKEWGISIGLGAISLPWGAAIRLFPDSWVAAILPWAIRKAWAPETISTALEKEHEEDDFQPPLRALSTLRGNRARHHIGFRETAHKAHMKAREAKDKMNGSTHALPR